ncbi:nuclear transport factor 2 family protein [Stenotrophomonas sp. Iso1]|uniref:nuclear transport factor 2 family protein n=1 Tax=Stenotrophomonas sp. Iso1 TaxID=2977283 RepID=UPI0022B7AF56|nr:nuclear transport factor 2 family protein [Stenotrophomonas sp. Iso1]
MIRTVLNCMLCAVIVLSMAACGRELPEQRLRQTIAAMQEAVEKGAPKNFMESVAEDFVGNGGLDRAGLERLLKGQLLLNPNVTVQTGPLSVEMGADDATATVRLSVLLAGGSGRFVPERGDMQELVSGWREEDGQWRLYSASWKPVGAD